MQQICLRSGDNITEKDKFCQGHTLSTPLHIDFFSISVIIIPHLKKPFIYEKRYPSKKQSCRIH